MKCPKCQYLSFDSGSRCRNCGYDFSLADDRSVEADEDLLMKTGQEPAGPLDDFALNVTPANLPLFTKEPADPDAPLVAATATPRAPLSVRRTAPTTRPRPKVRAPEPAEPRLALDTAEFAVVPELEVFAPSSDSDATAEATVRASGAGAVAPDTGTAADGARLAAALLDLALIGGIDATVLYFTLKICDLTWPLAARLPWTPLLTFFVILNGGYLSLFVAANGQTIGKMAAHIRVVPADPAAPDGERVSFGQAAVRAIGYLVSAVPLGLGFLFGFIGQRRALHDRLADTRVIRA